jgi:hypothetical protein
MAPVLLRNKSWNLRQRNAVTPGERCGVSPPSAFAVEHRDQRSKVILSDLSASQFQNLPRWAHAAPLAVFAVNPCSSVDKTLSPEVQGLCVSPLGPSTNKSAG